MSNRPPYLVRVLEQMIFTDDENGRAYGKFAVVHHTVNAALRAQSDLDVIGALVAGLVEAGRTVDEMMKPPEFADDDLGEVRNLNDELIYPAEGEE